MTKEEIEAECVNVLQNDFKTQNITSVGIIPLFPATQIPNWMFSQLVPEPKTILELAAATELLNELAFHLVLTDKPAGNGKPSAKPTN
jgi:hypothetical protein